MKKILLIILTLYLGFFVLAGCGSKTDTSELIVFAASSMTETITELGDAFMAEHEDVKIIYNFDSSGALKTQIQEGADVDVFISASQKQMDQLDIALSPEVNIEGMDCVLEGTRYDVLENKLVLSVPVDNYANICSYEDMAKRLRSGSIVLAMGNADVPAGQYTEKILNYFGLNEEELARAGAITYGSNVKEVTTQVSEGVVDCGIIYQTDAIAAKLPIVDIATADMCGQIIYPVAVMKASNNKELAKEFLDYLKTAESDAVFEKAGFTPVE